MRIRTTAQIVAGTAVLFAVPYWASGTEVVQSCQVDEYVYLPDAGYVTPARALEAETPFEGNVEVGMNEVDGSADLTVVEISATDGGYLATGVASCETTTAYGADAATAHPAGDYYDNATTTPSTFGPAADSPTSPCVGPRTCHRLLAPRFGPGSRRERRHEHGDVLGRRRAAEFARGLLVPDLDTE